MCLQFSSNLPVVTVQPSAELEADLKAMNSCVTMEANQNLSVAQKKLLKWHCKLGHLDFKQIQILMRSGGLGFDPHNLHCLQSRPEQRPPSSVAPMLWESQEKVSNVPHQKRQD